VSSYYPLFFDLSGKLCVIVGGGEVAERKARGLIEAGARVRVVSPTVTAGIGRLLEKGALEVVRREYREGDLEGAFLAFATTDRREVNENVAAESGLKHIPLNVADCPEQCDFIVPSRVDSGPVSIAISTSGLAPAVAKKLKAEVASILSANYGTYVKRIGAFRKFLMEHVGDAKRRRDILREVDQADIPDVCRMSLEEMKERFLQKQE
jgi:precorrin-2 dehydrogenase/sirohydrochlorin ferrochelatase